jgi:dipeptidyl aminopeptidase/acylaminoacyl peptidase
VIQQSHGRAAPARTYQDLLGNPHDEALFEHYVTSQVALVGLDGSVRPVGAPGVHVSARPAPNGQHILVATVHRPYSYLVPISRFPNRIEVWDATGTVVRTIADLPLQEEVSTAFDAVPTGPRDVSWRADAPATLVWAEALDQGDPSRPARKRDRLLMLEAPFAGEPRPFAELEFRLGSLSWTGRSDVALVTEDWWKTRRARTWVVNPAAPGASPRLLLDYSTEDRYNDPGRFITDANTAGEPVLLLSADRRSAYLEGTGGSPDGDRPFLDRIDLASGKTQRIWRSAAPYYEEVVTVVDPAARWIVTRRESLTEPPNYFLRDLSANRAAQLTRFTDPAPEFAGITRRLLTYKRGDGVDLSATLYLPAGYDSTQGPLPFLFWAYPREFKSAQAASQVTGSAYRFTRPTGSSHLLALTQGYGVLDGPTMPIVGEGDKEPNDTYIQQLVASAQAAVDKVVDMGVADRARIGIGGHSYGAFMTANLLAHSDLFRAGIARSGAYNRTLTPFGFQAEERTFWRARDVYMEMSPFTHADRINEPVLLIHGMADNNSGTFPIQSERLYAAIKGHGGSVRLVMLPAESHGYAARQSVGHVLWEMISWLDQYVKPQKGEKTASE